MGERLGAIPAAMWRVAVGSSINSMGLAFLWSLTTLYVHEHLDASMGVVAVILTAQQAAGLVGSLLGGTLFDQYGGRVPLLVSAAIGALSLTAAAIDGALAAFAAAAVLTGLSVGITFACLNALAPRAWPGSGRSSFNVVYVAFNVGVAVGPVLAGLLATMDFRLAFGVGAAALLGFWALVLQGYRGAVFERPEQARTDRRSEPSTGIPLRGLGWPIWVLVGGLLLDWMVYAQWFTLVPAFLHGDGIPLPLYSLLWTVNGFVVVLGQPVMNRLVRVLNTPVRQLVAGSLFFALAAALLVVVRTYPAYVAAMALSTGGEMLVWPAVPAAADTRTPVGRRGTVQGVVSTAGFAGRTVGPLVGVMLASMLAVRGVFTVLAAVTLAGGILYVLAERAAVPQTKEA